eukprot:evm.model.scf_594.3 EVM.evm.TU.scf_594.3   scf_594:63213-65071(-)
MATEEESDSTESVSDYMVVMNSNFTRNAAAVEGGALYTDAPRAVDVCCACELEEMTATGDRAGPLTFRRPWGHGISGRPNPCNSTWAGNTAGIGGDVVATTIASAMLCHGPGHCMDDGNIFQVQNHTSGEELSPINVILSDAVGNPPLATNALIRIRESSPDVILAGGLIVEAAANTTLSGMRMTSSINRAHDLTLTFDPSILSDARIRVNVRACLAGENGENLEIGSGAVEICSTCPDGFFSFEPSENCTICPVKATCRSSTVTPEEGLWHSSSKSVQIHKCIRADACKYDGRGERLTQQSWPAHFEGNTLDYKNNTRYGQCREGHHGILCGACDDGYGKVRHGDCVECGSRVNQVAFSCIVAAVYVGLVAFMARQALDLPAKETGIQKKESTIKDASTKAEGSTLEESSSLLE